MHSWWYFHKTYAYAALYIYCRDQNGQRFFCMVAVESSGRRKVPLSVASAPTFSISGGANSSETKPRSEDINVKTLSLFCRIVVATVVLLGSDGTMETPDEDGNFRTYRMDRRIHCVCRGTPMYSASPPAERLAGKRKLLTSSLVVGDCPAPRKPAAASVDVDICRKRHP